MNNSEKNLNFKKDISKSEILNKYSQNIMNSLF